MLAKAEPRSAALLVPAHLRKGETFAELAAGFAVGVLTAWRYMNETADWVAAGRPFYSEKHKHGMNLQRWSATWSSAPRPHR